MQPINQTGRGALHRHHCARSETLFDQLFGRGIMVMGPHRNDPERHVGVFNRELLATFPAIRAAEMEKFQWIAGQWLVSNKVPAGKNHPAYTDVNTYTYSVCEKGNWICITGADGREKPHITFDPFSRQWIYVLTEGAYGILQSPGWTGNQIVFTGHMTMIGVECEMRQTWIKKNADEIRIVNEEIMPDGQWVYVDEFDYQRKTASIFEASSS
jgi:hypothetical protein